MQFSRNCALIFNRIRESVLLYRKISYCFLFTFAETKSTCTKEGIINFQDKYLQRNFRRYKADRVFTLVERLRNAKVNRKQYILLCLYFFTKESLLSYFHLCSLITSFPSSTAQKITLKKSNFSKHLGMSGAIICRIETC